MSRCSALLIIFAAKAIIKNQRLEISLGFHGDLCYTLPKGPFKHTGMTVYLSGLGLGG